MSFPSEAYHGGVRKPLPRGVDDHWPGKPKGVTLSMASPFSRREDTRKQYALMRQRVATARLMFAESPVEKACATRWVNAWASAIGELQFARIFGAELGAGRGRDWTGIWMGIFLTA